MSEQGAQLREWVELEKAFRQATDRLVSSLQAENARLTSEVARLREALTSSVARMEQVEETIDGEWGAGRDLAQIEKDGDLHPALVQARAALAKP